MSIQATKAQRKQLKLDNAKYPDQLIEIENTLLGRPGAPKRIYRSKKFLVQIFITPFYGVERMSVCRTALDGTRWEANITWDELQRLKHECGYGELDAVEVYPADEDVVNVANMRHLFVMKYPVLFAWRKGSKNG